MSVYYSTPPNPIHWITVTTVLTNLQYTKFVTDISAILEEHSLHVDGRLKKYKLSNQIEMEKAVKKIRELQHPVFESKTIKDMNYSLPYDIFNYYHYAKYGFYQSF